MDEIVQLVDILTRTEAWLRSRGVDSPRLEAELLLGHVLGVERMQLYLAFDRPMAAHELDTLRPLVARRGDREPLAWILGTQAFHELDLFVGPGVLVPRPDTETLVEAALEWIPPADDPVYVADVGCGCGAVGLSLAHARPHIRVYATDVSPQALDATRRNVETCGLEERVAVLRGNLLDPVPARRPIDWVVSNPPYIPTRDIDGLMPEVSRYEPRVALDGGLDGLDVYRRLIPAAAARARRGMLVEVGVHQADAVVDLFGQHGFTNVEVFPDLAGIHRVVGGHTTAGQ